MTRRPLLAALLALPLLLFVAACSSDDNTDTPTQEDRDSFTQDVQDRLDGLNAEIEQLGDDVSNSDEADELREQRDELESKLDDLRNSSDEEWENAKDSINDSLNDLKDRLDGLKIGD